MLPDDFGLSPAETLAHICPARPESGWDAFWSRWDEHVWALHPRLEPRRGMDIDPSDAEARHHVVSTRFTSIGGRLLSPPEGRPVRAGVVVLHGYENPGPLSDCRRWEPLAEQGVAVFVMRVRGCPGSANDAGDLLSEPEGWIVHGLPDPQAWVLPHAVADVVCAVRGMAWWLGERGSGGGAGAGAAREGAQRGAAERLPVSLVGESLGAGLGAIAAARLAEASKRAEPGAPRLAKLVLGLPSLGDWTWRRRRPMLGAGGDLNRYIEVLREREDELWTLVGYLDAAVHARAIECPVLAKLALRDEIVPAPSAAAVVNNLSTPSASRYRFVVPCGHAFVGLANARRHALFEELVQLWLDPDVPEPQFAREFQSRMERRPAP